MPLHQVAHDQVLQPLAHLAPACLTQHCNQRLGREELVAVKTGGAQDPPSLGRQAVETGFDRGQHDIRDPRTARREGVCHLLQKHGIAFPTFEHEVLGLGRQRGNPQAQHALPGFAWQGCQPDVLDHALAPQAGKALFHLRSTQGENQQWLIREMAQDLVHHLHAGCVRPLQILQHHDGSTGGALAAQPVHELSLHLGRFSSSGLDASRCQQGRQQREI